MPPADQTGGAAGAGDWANPGRASAARTIHVKKQFKLLIFFLTSTILGFVAGLGRGAACMSRF
jgi:hypothetical protein